VKIGQYVAKIMVKVWSLLIWFSL